MNRKDQQQVMEKILEDHKDEINLAVKKAFYNYLVFGEGEITCGFCNEHCNNDWCVTKEDDGRKKN